MCGDYRNAYICIVNTEEKKPLAEFRRRWKQNIKTDRGQIVSESTDWIILIQPDSAHGTLSRLL